MFCSYIIIIHIIIIINFCVQILLMGWKLPTIPLHSLSYERVKYFCPKRRIEFE